MTTLTANNGQVSNATTIVKKVSLLDVLQVIESGGKVNLVTPQKVGKNYTFDFTAPYSIKLRDDGKVSLSGMTFVEGKKSIGVSADTEVEIITELATAAATTPSPKKKDKIETPVTPKEETKEEDTEPKTVAEKIKYYTAIGDVEALSELATQLNSLLEDYTALAKKQEKLSEISDSLNGGITPKKVKVNGTKKQTDPLSVAPIKPYRWSYQQYGDALYQCFLDLASDDPKKVKQATITLFSEFDMKHPSINEFKAGFTKALRSDLKAESMKFIQAWKSGSNVVSIGMLAKTWKKEESLMREELDRMKAKLGIK